MDNKYVLAMYDIRGKQEYIYRSNKLKEIVGGSAVIRDCFKDFLYPAAKEYRNSINKTGDLEAIFNYKTEKSDTDFDRKKFEERMDGNQYIGEVVYDGGGNFFVLYKNDKVCREVNKIFTRKILKKTYSLKVLCTFIDNIDFDDYKNDRDRLYKEHSIREASEPNEIPTQVLPFTQVDRMTSMPLYKKYKEIENQEAIKMSKEKYFKYKKYDEIKTEEKNIFGETLLDNLITKKGEESLLAVVYIDGNNMGAQIQDCLHGMKSYEKCVAEMRSFSEKIQKNYVDSGMKAIDKMLDEKYNDCTKRRFVIYARDEINFICNARDAYAAAKTYLKNLPQKDSACAGIAIFHSHAPYAEAYKIAEECCESGKTKMKKLGIKNASLIDFHYCQSGIEIDLETIRNIETNGKTSKPWFISDINITDKAANEQYISTEIAEAMAKELNNMARTNVKSLASHAKDSIPSLKMEIKRIEAHSKNKIKFDFYLEKLLKDDKLNDEEVSRLIYDIITVYDLWFDDNKERSAEIAE